MALVVKQEAASWRCAGRKDFVFLLSSEAAQSSAFDSWTAFHNNAVDSVAKTACRQKRLPYLDASSKLKAGKIVFKNISQLTMTSQSSLQSYTSLLSQKCTILSMTFLS